MSNDATPLDRQAVFLDADTMGADLSLAPLRALLPALQCHPHTAADDVGARVGQAQIILVNKVRLGKREFEHAPRLELVVLAATGTDNIDIIEAGRRGITVVNARDYSRNSVPQLALAMMLMLATRAHEYDRDVKNGAWSANPHFTRLDHPIVELKGTVLGIAGFGGLGRRLAVLAEPLGMEILPCNLPGREPRPDRPDLDEFLACADVVSLHCPLSEHTREMLGEREFGLMKPSAFLVNTARGQLVDESALARALKSGQIAGAGIDVLSQEPPPPDHPLLDPEIPNLVITPHNAWGSLQSRRTLLDMMIGNIRAFYAGSPRNVVTAS